MPLTLPEFDAVRVLVVGDVMLDQYWNGSTERVSPEAPVPVVQIDQEEFRIGGAGNVAVNAAALGAHTTLIAPVGPDRNGRLLARLLKKHGINNRLLLHPKASTPRKLRVVSQHQQLIRLDFEQGLECEKSKLLQTYRLQLKRCDVVILSDYGKGALNHAQELIRLAQAAKKPVFVDPKGDDFSRYHGATAITPNRKELEAVAGATPLEQISEQAARLCRKLRLSAMLVTLGEAGMLLQKGRKTQRLKTAAREVFDVTGAGDTVIAVFACAHAAGHSFEDAMQLANLAASQVVGMFGTAALSADELAQTVRRQHRLETGTVTRTALKRLVREAQACGEKVVLTNGCFDILHAGHVSLLERAAQLGDRLVVAVNSDTSVRKLKGRDRPIQALKYRQQVLAGLECVDWVVSFAQDTPENLIREVTPDILVKGADYKPSEIAGKKEVEKAGGKVVTLPLIKGHSTSDVVRRIKDKLR